MARVGFAAPTCKVERSRTPAASRVPRQSVLATKPSSRQRRLYADAQAFLAEIVAELTPGAAFDEVGERLKLEEQVLVTSEGVEILSYAPHDEHLSCA